VAVASPAVMFETDRRHGGTSGFFLRHNRASRLSVQEVPALEQQFPPPDQEHAAAQIEIDR
jgi:hypothetical protein